MKKSGEWGKVRGKNMRANDEDIILLSHCVTADSTRSATFGSPILGEQQADAFSIGILHCGLAGPRRGEERMALFTDGGGGKNFRGNDFVM